MRGLSRLLFFCRRGVFRVLPCRVAWRFLCWQRHPVLRINRPPFIRSSADGRWGRCHVLAVTENAVDVRAQVLCFHGSRPRARVFRGGLAGSRRSRRARGELLTHAKETAPRTRLEAARDLLVSPHPCQRSSSRLFIRSLIFKQQLKLVVSASD